MKARWVGCILAFCSLVGAASAEARSRYGRPGYRPYDENQSFRIRVGLFTPDGDSEFWDDNASDFTGSPEDFQDFSGGIDYTIDVAPNFAVMFSADEFEGKITQSYRNFEDNFGHRISHESTLEINPLRAGLMVKLAPPASPVVPYVGAGGGVYLWRYRERGDFIDFGSSSRPVFSTTLEDSGAAFGYYVLAGIEVPVSSSFSVLAEGRWDKVDDEPGGDFEGFPNFDLSGKTFQGGIAVRF